jgi:hypothetical protein
VSRFLKRSVFLERTRHSRLAFHLMWSAILVVALWVSMRFLSLGIANSLVCAHEIVPADAIVVENLEPDYLLFERARALHETGLASEVLVLTNASSDGNESLLSKEIAELMARTAHLDDLQTVPVRQLEPISLNATLQLRDFLVSHNVRSVLLVTPGFRSERSSLVYRAVMGRADISFSCDPVFGHSNPSTWAQTWHGIQEVVEQSLKLLYYRLCVLPAYSWH